MNSRRNKRNIGIGMVSRRLYCQFTFTPRPRVLTMFPHMSLIVSFILFTDRRRHTGKSLVLDIYASQISQITDCCLGGSGR
jgi:hypothetical protein